MQKILNKSALPKLNTQYNTNSSMKYSYLIGVAMLYMMFQMLSGLLVYKIVHIGPFMASAGVFLTPIIYCLSNVTTEVYGYETARNMMWWFVFSSITFVTSAVLLTKVSSPETFQYQEHYDLILGVMPRICIAGTIGTIVALSFNNYFLSKLKIRLQGKAYWLRSLMTTGPGEIIYNLIAYPIMFLGKVPVEQLIHIFITVSCFKLATTFLLTPGEWFLANYLKKREGVSVFDYNVNYNIFKFKLNSVKPDLKAVKI